LRDGVSRAGALGRPRLEVEPARARGRGPVRRRRLRPRGAHRGDGRGDALRRGGDLAADDRQQRGVHQALAAGVEGRRADARLRRGPGAARGGLHPRPPDGDEAMTLLASLELLGALYPLFLALLMLIDWLSGWSISEAFG